MENKNQSTAICLKATILFAVVFLGLTLMLTYPFSVGITGTETRQISPTEVQKTTFLQDPFFGARIAVKQEIEEAPAGPVAVLPSNGYTVRKIDAETGTVITRGSLDPRPMTIREAVSLGLPADSFAKRFLLPGLFPAALIGFLVGSVAFMAYSMAALRKGSTE